MTAALFRSMRSPLLITVLWSATAFAQAPGETPPTTESPSTQPPGETPPSTQAPGEAPPSTQAPAETPTQAPGETPAGPPPPGTSTTTTTTTTTQAPGQTPPSKPVLSAIDVDSQPEACRDLAKLANSTSKPRALSARISLASCLVDEQTKTIVLCDCAQSVIDIDAAIAPSLALLDEVAALGDPVNQILARHAQGEILSSFATRMLATVPPPLNSSEEAIALHDTRLAMLQPLLVPWQERAQVAYTDVDNLARKNPKLAKNPAVAAAVRGSRAKLAPVAKR
jgi:hypothetical protein